jgi:uncharacterized protein (DUF305 family)
MKQIIILSLVLLFISGCTSNNFYDMHHPEITSEESFLAEMIPHHKEAIKTSKYMLRHSNNLDIKDLAGRIIVAQEEEIVLMENLLNNIKTGYRATYVDMMRPLNKYEGVELDIVFLEDMIHHHEMAIIMALQVQRYDLSKEVEELVLDIINVQTDEVKEMILILHRINS